MWTTYFDGLDPVVTKIVTFSVAKTFSYNLSLGAALNARCTTERKCRYLPVCVYTFVLSWPCASHVINESRKVR